MHGPQSRPKSYFVLQGEQEVGPLTLAQLNGMRSRGQLSADTPCREATDPGYRPLDVMFPHLAQHARKSAEELKREARAMEGNGIAYTALGCSILSWIIATPILSWFGIVMGAKSYVFAHRAAGLYAVLVGILAFMFWLARVLGYIPAE